jgi:hypothetical protein
MCFRTRLQVVGVCGTLLLFAGCATDQELYTQVMAYGDSESAAILQRRISDRLPGPTHENYNDAVSRLKSLAADGQIVDAMIESQYIVNLNEVLRHRAAMMGVPFLMTRTNLEHLVEGVLEKAMKEPSNIEQLAWAAELHVEFSTKLQELVNKSLSELLNKPMVSPGGLAPAALSEAFVRYYKDNKGALVWDSRRHYFAVHQAASPHAEGRLPVGFEPVLDVTTQPTAYPARIICVKDGSEMVYVPRGPLNIKGASFEVGGFYMDRYVVTKEKYAKFCAATGRKSFVPAELAGSHPAINVTLKDAVAYAAWVGKVLPSKSQWLRAACGDDPEHVPWVRRGVPAVPQPKDRDEYAIFERYGGELKDQLGKVGGREKGESPFGAQDMIGNVNQILGSEEGGIGECIGGSYCTVWNYAESSCLSWGTSWNTSKRYDSIGFRCILPSP